MTRRRGRKGKSQAGDHSMSRVPTTRHHHHGNALDIRERETGEIHIIQWFWQHRFHRILPDGSVAHRPFLTVLVPIQFQNEGKEIVFIQTN